MKNYYSYYGNKERKEKNKDLVLIITNQKSGDFLGICALTGRGNPQKPEFGIWLKKSAHRNKYGIETFKTLALWAVKNIEFDYIIYPVDKANIPSRKIPEYFEGIIIEAKIVKTMNGGYLDEVI